MSGLTEAHPVIVRSTVLATFWLKASRLSMLVVFGCSLLAHAAAAADSSSWLDCNGSAADASLIEHRWSQAAAMTRRTTRTLFLVGHLTSAPNVHGGLFGWRKASCSGRGVEACSDAGAGRHDAAGGRAESATACKPKKTSLTRTAEPWPPLCFSYSSRTSGE